MKKLFLLITLCLFLAFTGTTSMAKQPVGQCWICSIEFDVPVCEMSYYGYMQCSISSPIYCDLDDLSCLIFF